MYIKKVTPLLFFIAVFLGMGLSLCAQDKVLFEDNFQTNTNEWYSYYDSPKTFVYKNQKFSIISEYAESLYRTIPLDDRYDFAIELEFSFSKKNKDELISIGFVDELYPSNRLLYFVLHTESYFAILSNDRGEKKDYQKYTKIVPFDFSKKPCFEWRGKEIPFILMLMEF